MYFGAGRRVFFFASFFIHQSRFLTQCLYWVWVSNYKQLKDSILDGSHPYADFLREKSGLVFLSRDDGNVMDDNNHDSVTAGPNLTGAADVQNMRAEVNPDPLILETRNKQLGENLHDGDVLHLKRDRSGSASKDVAGNIHENCNGKNISDDQYMNVKRMKQYAYSDNQPIEQNPVPFTGREPLEDSSERDVPVTTRGHDFPESEMGTREEGGVLENGCNKCTVTERSWQSNSDGILRNVLENPCNSPVMPKVIRGDEIHRSLSVDEGKGVSNLCAQSSGAFQSLEQNTVCLRGKKPIEEASERDVRATVGEGGILEDGCNEGTISNRSQKSNDDEGKGVSNLCAQSSGAFRSLDQNTVCLRGKKPIEEASERDVRATVGEGAVLEDGCNEGTVSNRSQKSNDDELHKNQSEIISNAPVVLQDTATDDPCQHLSVDEAKDDGEPFAEPSRAPSHESVDKTPTKQSKRSCEHDFQIQEPNYASYDRAQQNTIASEAQEEINACGEAEMSSDSDEYHNEWIDVAKKKHDFLSSQSTGSHDSLIDEWTQQNLCMKCNEGGSLLVCNTNNCQVVIHEKCGGSLSRFDDQGKFYCPFCAYSLAITEYLEAKKRSSLANKELAAFIRMGSEHQPEKSAERLNKEKHHSTVGNADEDVLRQNHENEQLGGTEKYEANQAELNVNEDNSYQCQNSILRDQEAEISAPCNNNVNLECREKRTRITKRRLCVPTGEKEDAEKVVKECPSARRFEGQQNEVPEKRDNVSGEGTDVVLVNQGKADVGIQRQVLQGQAIDARKRLVYEFDVNSEGTSENDDHDSVSNYFIGVRKKESCW